MKAESKSSVKPIPEGYHTITPFLIADNAGELIKFIERAFEGKVKFTMKSDEGVIVHSEMFVGNSIIMISDSTEEFKPVKSLFHLYVENADSVFKKAIEAGAESIREPENQFYGDRSGGVKDKWGNQWWISTHIEDVSDEEMKRREEEFRKKKN